MKSLNGLLFILIGGAIIWIGATGRLPALAAALGMVRRAPGTTAGTAPRPNEFSDVTGGSSSTVSGAATSNQFMGLTPKGEDVWKSMQQPFLNPWKDVLGLQ